MDYIKVEEGGVGGFDLLGTLEGIQRVIVVDVMMADIEPGNVRLYKGRDLAEPGKRIVSFHQIGVLELVQMWGLLGYKLRYSSWLPDRRNWSGIRHYHRRCEGPQPRRSGYSTNYAMITSPD